MGLSAGASVAGVEIITGCHSIRTQSALVETRSTRLTWRSFFDSYKLGGGAMAPAIVAQGVARVAAIKVMEVVRFMSCFYPKGSS